MPPPAYWLEVVLVIHPVHQPEEPGLEQVDQAQYIRPAAAVAGLAVEVEVAGLVAAAAEVAGLAVVAEATLQEAVLVPLPKSLKSSMAVQLAEAAAMVDTQEEVNLFSSN